MRLHVSAKADYAVRALVVLASQPEGRSVKTAEIANDQDIPVKFLENIMVELRRKGLVTSMRGPSGGFRINRPAKQISIAEVLEAVDGPLLDMPGHRPARTDDPLAPSALHQLWVAAETGVRDLFRAVTVADLLTGSLAASAAASTPAGSLAS